MGTASRGLARSANKRGAETCPRKGTVVHQILPFEQWARAVWQSKPVAQLHALTRRSVRTCKYWIAGDRDPSYEDVVALLRSEHGFSFLQHVMGAARPAWWRGISKTRSLATMRKEHDAMRRRIEQLELTLD